MSVASCGVLNLTYTVYNHTILHCVRIFGHRSKYGFPLGKSLFSTLVQRLPLYNSLERARESKRSAAPWNTAQPNRHSAAPFASNGCSFLTKRGIWKKDISFFAASRNTAFSTNQFHPWCAAVVQILHNFNTFMYMHRKVNLLTRSV